MMLKNASLLLLMFNQILLLVTSEKNLSQLASIHFARIVRDAKCGAPVPRIVYISDLKPPPNKKYLPYATLLHACGPQFSCCHQESDTCVAKSVQKVELYFWVHELTPQGSKKSVESIVFNNHTECECRHRSLNISNYLFQNYLPSIHTRQLTSIADHVIKDSTRVATNSSFYANCATISAIINNLLVTFFFVNVVLK